DSRRALLFPICGSRGRSPHPGTTLLLPQSILDGIRRLICHSRQPKMGRWPGFTQLIGTYQNPLDQLPNLGKRITPTSRRFAAFILQNQDRFLVRQRPAGIVNAHLWEFPNVELNGADLSQAAKEVTGITPKKLEAVCTIKHSITHY